MPLQPPPPIVGQSRPKKITLDSQGRLIDDKGKVIEIDKPVELKVNQKMGATQPKVLDGAFNSNSCAVAEKGIEAEAETDYQQLLKKRMFYDSSLEAKSKKANRSRRALAFTSHGTYIKQGDKMRKQ